MWQAIAAALALAAALTANQPRAGADLKVDPGANEPACIRVEVGLGADAKCP